MVTTKHCCWGTCYNDSGHPDKLHPALKLLLGEGKEVFRSFPKKLQVGACGRGEAFTVDHVKKDT